MTHVAPLSLWERGENRPPNAAPPPAVEYVDPFIPPFAPR